MIFDDDKVREILQKLPSEGPCIDYKEVPYRKDQNHSFIKDVVAMLNSEAAAGQDKFIIVGIEDKTREKKGIDLELWRDDNEWQNLINKIAPRPDVRTGHVQYENRWFGWIYIPSSNNEWVYEIQESVISSKDDRVKETNIVAKGQAFTRNGSVNMVLMSDGRSRLLNKRIQNIGLNNLINSGIINDAISVVTTRTSRCKLAIAFVGCLNENSTGDMELVEKLSKIDKEGFMEEIRMLREQKPDLLSYSQGYWKLTNHKNYLLDESKYLYDTHIDIFYDCMTECFSAIDPKYNLPSDKRSYASLYPDNMNKKYSGSIMRGLAETLAILGNNINSFTNCSKHKVMNCIYKFERYFFAATDWKIYASSADVLHLFGEACPDVFMKELNRLLSEKDKAFVEFMNEKEESITIHRYGYQLGWALANIAKVEQYFAEAMEILMLLSILRAEFVDIMVGVVLPWYPQTHASLSMRIEIFGELAKENNEQIWIALMKLMPHVTTTGNPIQDPEYMIIDPLPNTIKKKDYYEATIGYIRLAKDLIGIDVNRMCSMISVIDDVDYEIQKEIVLSIKEKAVFLEESDKAVLWNKLQDFILQHRKFADADWALNEERLDSINDLANWLIPNDDEIKSIRLFRNDQYSLLEEKGNYDEETQKLKKAQDSIVRRVYNSGGTKEVLQFVEKVENKRLAGNCASAFLNDEDLRDLSLLCWNSDYEEFLGGLIISIPFERLKCILEGLSPSVKACILSKAQLSDKIIKYVDSLDDESQKVYWERVSVWPLSRDSLTMIEKTVNNLNKCKRYSQSISVLFDAVRNKKSINSDTVVNTLNLYVEEHTENDYNTYHIQELIKWLQSREKNRTNMLTIEWEYLSILKESQGYAPIFLWDELSSNPVFYVDIIKILVGKENSMSTDEEKQKRSVHCYELMASWKRVPGQEISGIINTQKLEAWYKTVVSLSKESDVVKAAMHYFGKVLFYAPAAEDGFFIHTEVAKYLQGDKEGAILDGYHCEAINSRGAHFIDPTGEPEFKLEEGYTTKAKAADEKGLFRLAQTLRDIANEYHEEGLHNIEDSCDK